jgi:hypothetical protein
VEQQQLLWKPAEFAELIRVSRARAYEILAANPQLAVKVGSSLRVVPERARAWIAQLQQQNGDAAASAHSSCPTR